MGLSTYANAAAIDAALAKADAALPATGTAADSSKLGGVAASGYAKEISGVSSLPYSIVADDDVIPIHDTSATTQKKITWSGIKFALKSHFMPSTDNQVAFTAIDDADYLTVYDSSEMDIEIKQKKTLWSNIKSVLKTYFDTLYSNVGTTNGILKANGSGTISAATAGTDYLVDIVSDTTPQLGGELDMNGKSIGGTETDNGNSGTSKTIDWRNGNHQKVTMTGNCTFTFTAPSKAGMLSLRIIQDATGSRTITLPTMKKPGGTAFTFSTAANSIDILSVYYDGSAYYGQLSANFS